MEGTRAMDELRAYHLDRFRSEREWANRSGDHRAYEAHMGLRALHLEQLLRLDREAAARAPAWSSTLGAG